MPNFLYQFFLYRSFPPFLLHYPVFIATSLLSLLYKLLYIQNGVDLSEVDQQRQLENPLKEKDGKKRIGFIGQMISRKNIFDILDISMDVDARKLPYNYGFNESFVTILYKEELSVFNAKNPIPANALQGDKAVIDFLNLK